MLHVSKLKCLPLWTLNERYVGNRATFEFHQAKYVAHGPSLTT